MLDVDHGTYPYVTSSNSVAGAVLAGAGIGAGHARVVARHHQGVHDARRQRAVPDRARRGELGDTAAPRRRRVRRDDRPAAPLRLVRRRRSCATPRGSPGSTGSRSPSSTCSPASIRLRICVAYRSRRVDDRPRPGERACARAGRARSTRTGRASSSLSSVGRLEDLPANARRYLDRIAELTGAPVHIVSVGARREDTIVIDDPFAWAAGAKPGCEPNNLPLT